MDNNIINVDLLKKILAFMKKTNSLKYLDPNIFETIDSHKEISDMPFNDYYLEYIKSLPKLDFESVVKISREVYQQYGREKDFDQILEKLRSNYGIDYGSLNKDDDNCITKATERRVLLSGTYYDVVLLCHEIGHKLRYSNSLNSSLNSIDIMETFFFETPPIVFEYAASNHLRDTYGVDIHANEMRKTHISSTKRGHGVENNVFLVVMNLLKQRKLSAVNLYLEFIKNPNIVEYLNRQGVSIENCVEEGMSDYSYDIGYILGSYINNSENKIENLNMLLKYKDNGINMPFTIDERIIQGTLENSELMEQQGELQQTNGYTRKLTRTSSHSRAFISSSFIVVFISFISVALATILIMIGK